MTAADFNRRYPKGCTITWTPRSGMSKAVTGRTTTQAYTLSTGKALVHVDGVKHGVPLVEIKVNEVEAVP